jgi:hypothetical protein
MSDGKDDYCTTLVLDSLDPAGYREEGNGSPRTPSRFLALLANRVRQLAGEQSRGQFQRE